MEGFWTDSLRNHAHFHTSIDKKTQVFYGDFENKFGPNVIVKRISCYSEAEGQNAEQEARFTELYPHPGICKCLEIAREPNSEGGFYVYLVFPRMPRSLKDEIAVRKETNCPYSESELQAYYSQLLDVYCHLEQHLIVHRDIKPGNILLDPQGRIQICDFGFTKLINSAFAQMHSIKMTPCYAAPALKEASHRPDAERYAPVQHNPFKSDVFSLGMTMLHLSLLEMPKELMGLPAQQAIDRVLGTLNYSARWRDLLRYMLEVNEFNRPTFTKLREPLPYANDEALAPIVGGVETQDLLRVTVKSGLSYVRVSETEVDEVPCMISIQTVDLSPLPRTQGVDVVCVIDKSGSMKGNIMNLLKRTLADTVDLLCPYDRLALVSFDDSAEVNCPLVCCSDEGKRKLKTIISSLNCENWTDIAKGFLMGLSVLQQRRYINYSASLLLFSDGQNNRGGDPAATCFPALEQCGLSKLTVCTFGYGGNLDTALLSRLAEQGKGCFQPITRPEQIKQVFGYAIGNITTVVARDLTVKVNTMSSSIICDISKLYTKEGEDSFSFPHISKGEQKDLIFLLKPRYNRLYQPTRCEPVSISISYTENDGTKADIPAPLTIKFTGFDGQKAQEEASVFKHWYRVCGADYIRLARSYGLQGDKARARGELVAGIQRLKAGGYQSNSVVKPVIADLERALAMLNGDAVWSSGIDAHFISISYSHLMQSASSISSQYATSHQGICAGEKSEARETELSQTSPSSQQTSPRALAPKLVKSDCKLS